MSSEEGNFDQLRTKLCLKYLNEKLDNKTARKKGNLRRLRAENSRSLAIFLNHVAIIASRAQGVHLSEPLPYLVLSPLPVESSGIQWVMGPVRMC